MQEERKNGRKTAQQPGVTGLLCSRDTQTLQTKLHRCVSQSKRWLAVFEDYALEGAEYAGAEWSSLIQEQHSGSQHDLRRYR